MNQEEQPQEQRRTPSPLRGLLNHYKQQERIKQLEEEVKRLRGGVSERQEQIAKTNGYYKGLFRTRNSQTKDNQS